MQSASRGELGGKLLTFNPANFRTQDSGADARVVQVLNKEEVSRIESVAGRGKEKGKTLEYVPAFSTERRVGTRSSSMENQRVLGRELQMIWEF